ncbi:MAG: efflux RND transporter periplasmic adaptor subunit [Bacteroidales bacterium]|nr:efflux RND transporter periplasmic adaptor subunit [Bacteroidales bacterium]
MKKTIKIMALTALVVIGCAGCKDKNKNAAISNQKITIRTQQVSAQDVEQVYEYTATVEAEAVNNIAPLTGGRIDKIYVEVGDRVSKGKVLVQMNENSLKQSKAQLDNLKTSFNRLDELYKVGGCSKSDWDAMKTQLDVAQTTYDNLLENTRLISPINGVVSARNYDSGDLYGGLPVVTIQQINPVKMKINLSESLFQKVKVGMPVSVKVDAYGDEEFKGRISLIYPTIDGATHTFPVEVQLPNANSRVRPGMYARVTVNFGTSHHVVVPDEAIFRQQGSGNRYVYVYKNGKVSFNQVEIGRHIDNSYELLSGNVQDGDMVATTGLARLKDGLEVNVENK